MRHFALGLDRPEPGARKATFDRLKEVLRSTDLAVTAGDPEWVRRIVMGLNGSMEEQCVALANLAMLIESAGGQAQAPQSVRSSLQRLSGWCRRQPGKLGELARELLDVSHLDGG
jgi:hypothetical protein